MLDTLTKENMESHPKENKVVEDSATSCKEVTKEVEKIIPETQTFMANFQSSSEENTSNMNEVIMNLGRTHHTKKEAPLKVCTELQTSNNEFQTFISNQTDKLHEDLAVESKIMDELSAKQMRVGVLSIKITQANNKINELKSECAVVKNCVLDVNVLLSNLLETHDTLLPLTTRRHLADKICPAIALFNRLEGVSASSIQKKGGETTMKDQPPTTSSGHDEEKPKASNELKDNVSSGSKGNEKMVESDEDVPNKQELK